MATTGTELLVWGGLGDHRDGAAYDAATGLWRRIADPPDELSGRNDTQPPAVFTGHEMIVVSGPLHLDGTSAAAYDPETDRWRMIPTPPFDMREGMFTAWTGREAIFYGGAAGDTLPDDTGFAYDPAADQWRDIPESPLGSRAGAGVAWTGTELVVLGGSAQKSSAEPHDPQRDGAAYDPRTDTWRMLPPSPYGSPRAAYGTSLGVIVFDDRCFDACTTVSFLDPSTGVWRDIAGVPYLDHRYTTAVGDEVWGWSTDGGAAISAATASWRPLSPLPDALTANTAYATVSARDAVFVMGRPGIWQFVGGATEEAAARAAERARAAAAAAAARARQGSTGAAYRLLAFALQPSDESFAAIPFADDVTFAFGTTVLGSRTAGELRQPENWTVEFPPSAFTGQFSVLDALSDASEVSVTNGPHGHCAGEPFPPPPGAEGLTQTAITPTQVDSCLQWFAVDLYLRDGKIAFVRYDLYEP
jgi:hypothetical protein